jgi:hypothetical protein
MAEESSQVNSYRVPKIPPFWSNDPETWFISVESSFRVARISDDTTKFHTIVANADTSILTHIKDIIRNPPAEGKYDTLKKRLLNSFETSQDARLRQPLKGQVLGDKKPSHFLQELKNLAGDQCTDNILKTLFVEQLPENYRVILATIDEPDLNRFAAIADKIADSMSLNSALVPVSSLQSNDVSAVSNPRNNNKADPFDDKTVDRLAQKILAKLNLSKHGARSRSKSRSSRSSRNRSKSRDDESKECFYHSRFGSKARKCQKPCSWVDKPAKENLKSLTD